MLTTRSRPLLFALLTLLTLSLVSIEALAQAQTPSAPFALRWPHGALSGRWSPEDGVLLESSSKGDGDNFDSYTAELLSAVGPMVSVRVRSASMTPDSVHVWRSEFIELRTREGYHFDLETWLRESKQSGEVVTQLIERLQLPAERCPKRSALSHEDRSLGYWVGYLEASGCMKDGGRSFQFLGSDPKSFAIVDWNPEQGMVTLRVEAQACHVTSIMCELETVDVAIYPPDAWIPWLNDAARGRGLLAADAFWHTIGVDGAALRLARRVELGSTQRALYVARARGRMRVHIAGVDNQPHGQVCFDRIALVRPDSEPLDLDAQVPLCVDVASAAELEAAKLGADATPAALARAFPLRARSGALFLLSVGDWIERALPGSAVPINRRGQLALERYRQWWNPGQSSP